MSPPTNQHPTLHGPDALACRLSSSVNALKGNHPEQFKRVKTLRRSGLCSGPRCGTLNSTQSLLTDGEGTGCILTNNLTPALGHTRLELTVLELSAVTLVLGLGP